MSDPTWSKTPPTSEGEFWLRGPGFKTAVAHVYEAKVHTLGGNIRRLEVSHPSFGHMEMKSRYLEDFEWGPQVSEPPA